MMARPRRKLAEAHLAQFSAHCLLGDGDAKFLEHPLAKIDASPTHDAMDCRRWSFLDHFHQRGAVRVIELWSLPGRLAVDQSVGTTGVEAQNPIADDLKSDTAVLRRPASQGAIVDRSESQQPARLRPVLRALGKRPQSTGIIILSKPNRRRHDEPPRVRQAKSDFSRFENPPHESALARAGITRLREGLKLSHDADTRRSISEEARLIRQEVARIKNKPEFVRSAIRSDIDQFVEGFAIQVASEVDANINAQIHRLAGYARDALTKSSRHAVEDARRSLQEARDLLFGELAKQPGFWLARFEHLAEERHLAIDKELHDRLVSESEAAVRCNDIDAVRNLSFRLGENMVRVGGPGHGEALAGLTRD